MPRIACFGGLTIKKPSRSRAPRRPGRPARPWIKPRIAVAHPFLSHQVKHVTQEQAVLWTGRSRQTVARWASLGACPDIALQRLLALYAHGLPPIPPDLYAHPCAEHWGRFSFAFDYTRPIKRKAQIRYQWCLITPCSGRALNWAQVDACGEALRNSATLHAALERSRLEASTVGNEAARLRDLVANGA